MAESVLFTPIQIRNHHLSNRIIIAPMCQYSAVNGCMNDWHQIHLGQLALSGAALLTIEATAVLPEGRISWADVGLWNAETETAMHTVLASIRRWSDMPVALQLAHAGRKASTEVPWAGGKQLAPADAHGWQTVAPSSLPFDPSYLSPGTIDSAGLTRIKEAFVASARRAGKLGIDVIQIHGAHGYLLHQFLSPLSNRRDDEYGGSLANRMKFPLEIFDAVRDAFPADRAISFRVSGTDWIEGGWDIEQTIEFATALEKRGCDVIHISSGGLHVSQQIPVGPSYQVPLARAVKAAVKMPVVAVGLITSATQAEAIIATGDADMIALARTILFDPRWPWHAAAELGASIKAPKQYLRSQPHQYKELFGPSVKLSPEPAWSAEDKVKLGL